MNRRTGDRSRGLCNGKEGQMELNCPSCGKLSGKQEANMNWIKCIDMNKQPIYVNIENATSIFWIEKEKASIIGFPSGGDSIKVIEPPEAIIRGE